MLSDSSGLTRSANEMSGFTDAIPFVAVALLGSSLLFFVPLWGPRVVFGRAPTQVAPRPRLLAFSIGDLLVLVAYIATANAFVSGLRNMRTTGWFIFMVVATNSLFLLAWYLGLRFMWERNIERVGQRLLFQFVLYPRSVLGPSGVLMSGIMLISSFENPSLKIGFRSAALGGLVVSLLVMFATRRILAVSCAGGMASTDDSLQITETV